MTQAAMTLTHKVRLSRFTDRAIFKHLDRAKIRFFNRAGGAVRKTAKRSLRQAAQIRISDMDVVERAAYQRQMKRFKEGKRRIKPRRPDKTATRGNPPLLHVRPKSPLRELIFFGIDNREESTIIGPSQFRGGKLDRLEKKFPFMAPALKKIEPQFPQFVSASVR
jgi:hypothetical protein